ncbi:hypothetical protein FOL46_001696 [Perkinsus olseni]|uniref:Uncharacterized protein n=1 Tax=Perkinsus olseni TaxID=32597 RepID=A0A7J6MV22_PEROL|nr:hypothetical protein FOL46_001696 [Perkinsus olseni]
MSVSCSPVLKKYFVRAERHGAAVQTLDDALLREVEDTRRRLEMAESEISHLTAELDEVCLENSELKDRYMTAGERFERLMESEEEHTKELTRQLEEERIHIACPDEETGSLSEIVKGGASWRDFWGLSRSPRPVDTEAEEDHLSELWHQRLEDNLRHRKSVNAKRTYSIRQAIKQLVGERDDLKEENTELKNQEETLREDVTSLSEKGLSRELDDTRTRATKLNEEVKVGALSSDLVLRNGELAELRATEAASAAKLAAAREHISAMVGMMDRIMKMPDGEKMGEELADALGKGGAFYPVLSRYDRRVARRVSDILQEAEDEKTRAMARVREQMDDLAIRRDELEQERSFLCEERQQLQEDLEALAHDLQNICQERQLAEGDYGHATGPLGEDRNAFDLLEQARASVAKLEGERKVLTRCLLSTYRGGASRLELGSRTGVEESTVRSTFQTVNLVRTVPVLSPTSIADLQLLKDRSKAELAAARENMTVMMRTMERIIELRENENLRNELREALGDSRSFHPALARYAEEITERISTIRREAEAGVKPVAAHSNYERESQYGAIELELEHQTSIGSASVTAATQRSVEVQAALGRETVPQDRCLDEKVEEERSGFDGEMSTALEHTKDAFRVEIGRLESEVVELKRLFEQELRRVKEEAELRLENFKQHIEEQRVEERRRAALKLEDVAREKEQLEMDKFRLQNSLDVAQRKLSELSPKNSSLVNGDPVVNEIDPLIFAGRNTYRIGRIGKLRSPIASSGRRIPAGKGSEAPLAIGSPSPSLPDESCALSTICSTTPSPAKDRRRPSRRLQPSSSCLASTTVDPKHRCKALVAEWAQLNFEDG